MLRASRKGDESGAEVFAPENPDSNTIAHAAIPFFGCLVVCVVLIMLFPKVVTSLPNVVMSVENQTDA